MKVLETLERLRTYKQVAEALDMSPEAVRATVNRIRWRYIHAREFCKSYQKWRLRLGPGCKYLNVGAQGREK
ncbi:MAG: hypothetical protein ACYCQJ_16155 [Nitrososphaerales archaeon]